MTEHRCWEEFKKTLEKMNAFQSALTLFDWDNETQAPPQAAERTAETVGVLSAMYHAFLVSEEMAKQLQEVKQLPGLSSVQAAIVKQTEKEIEKLRSIPQEEYRRFSELTALSVSRWSQAKKENDYSLFAPVLTEIIDWKKKFAAYRRKDGQSLYQVLLSDYEEGFTEEKLDPFFDQLKTSILPLVKAAAEREPVNAAFLFLDYDVEKQRQWNRWLAAYLGFDFARGVLAESEHPFTTSLHRDDVRITTHYYENNLESAVFSTIHETGHALFEQGNSEAVTQTLAAGGTCGVHESQSRLYENILGRSRAFWKPIYPRLKKQFPDQLEKVSLDQFIKAVNRTAPGLVRTEADELTYCLHIIIRYELEKQLIDGSLTTEALPEAWERLYESYLGKKPATCAEGVLQDIHWAMGEFGYFPSYALGNAMAAQIYAQMEKEMDVEGLLENRSLVEITEYLRKHIHQYGASRNMNQLLEEMTGESFNPAYYIAYLEKKYGTGHL